MNDCMKNALQRCVESELQEHGRVEFVVPKLKRVWPQAWDRNELTSYITTFAADNGWVAQMLDFRFRVRFVRPDVE